MSRGLVLEGGAMRGLFTAGVLDVLMENGIKFDTVIGVSAGAAFGCNYVSGQIGRTIRYNLKYADDSRYCGIKSLITTGDVFGADFCYHQLPRKLDVFDEEAFINSDTEFYFVVTDVLTGQPVYHRMDNASYEELEWLRASASMPLMANIVEIQGGKYLDGGVTDSIPLKASEVLGNAVNVTVLTQPRGYRKEANKLMPIVRYRYRDYPEFVRAMELRHIMYNEELAYAMEKEKNGENFIICPKSPLPLGHISHDIDKIKETYELGRNEANEVLPALLRFLERNDPDKVESEYEEQDTLKIESTKDTSMIESMEGTPEIEAAEDTSKNESTEEYIKDIKPKNAVMADLLEQLREEATKFDETEVVSDESYDTED